jgi:hypothetical protein
MKIKSQCRDVVDDRGAGIKRCAGDFGFCSINGDGNVRAFGEFFNHRHNSLNFFFCSYWLSARAR